MDLIPWAEGDDLIDMTVRKNQPIAWQKFCSIVGLAAGQCVIGNVVMGYRSVQRGGTHGGKNCAFMGDHCEAEDRQNINKC